MELTKKPRFEASSASEALQPQPPIDWVYKNLAGSGSVILFHGEAGSKKTYATAYMLACASVGMKFLQFETKKVKCLIIDEESGNTRLLRRLGEILRGAMIEDPSNIDYISLEQVKLDNTTDVIDLLNFIKVHNYELILIDALADVMDGDENSKEHVQPVFNNLRKIAEETGAVVMVIHHSNKMGGYRGSSAIKGSVDLMLEITSSNGSNIIKFTSQKERDIERITFSAKAIWEDDKFYLQPLDLDDEIESLSDAERCVYRLLENGELFLKEIESKAMDKNFTSSAATMAINLLSKKGLIQRTNEGGRGKPAKYGINKKDSS